MLIYLYGPDTYRSQQKQREIVAAYLKKYPEGAVGYFFLDNEEDFLKLQTFGRERSLFSKVKIGVVYQADEELDGLIPFLKEQLEVKDVTLIVCEEKKLAKAFDFLLEKPSQAQEFKLLEGATLAAYLKKEIARFDLKVSAPVVQELIAAYESDLWAIISELEKVSLGGRADFPGGAPEFFPAVQQLKYSGPVGRRLGTLFHLLENEEPAAVFNMLAALVSGGEKIKMADYDVAIKSGKLEYPEALLDFVLTAD